MVDDDVGPEAPGHFEALGNRIHTDDETRAAQLRAERRAESDGALGEDRHRIAHLDVAAFRPTQSRREDVGHEHDLLVGEGVRNVRQIGARVRDEEEVCPGPIDRVAEPPAAQRSAALRVRAVQAVEALTARRNGADDHALADLILGLEPLTKRLDDPDGLVSEDQSRPHGVLAFDDVHVGAADRRRRDADHGLPSLRLGLRPILEYQPVRASESHGSHRAHVPPPWYDGLEPTNESPSNLDAVRFLATAWPFRRQHVERARGSSRRPADISAPPAHDNAPCVSRARPDSHIDRLSAGVPMRRVVWRERVDVRGRADMPGRGNDSIHTRHGACRPLWAETRMLVRHQLADQREGSWARSTTSWFRSTSARPRMRHGAWRAASRPSRAVDCTCCTWSRSLASGAGPSKRWRWISMHSRPSG